ncbi:hypothetical protein CkaCkLH20_11170 [Colletotrichum karsti]|uniref:DUF7730 domain-containing protein n=1 Tax=Colletotrichum karsti TaxID=1095194 RepID=A0A9P6HVK2_9PEZI|nr:uncharacterized protein CkaCkLH20_11170 [Colletotrichum karsti]KAF9871249.1 hypothetical protein CkaCkLH20_11170 [Colletotrichum karsti]
MHKPTTYAKGKRYGILGYLPELGSKEAVLWDLNATVSPLLRLPPEIRNKIYSLLLSSRRIHVMHDPKTSGFHCVTLRPAANPWTYVENCDDEHDHDSDGENQEKKKNRRNGHNKRKSKRKGKRHLLSRGLTLLSPVCRQLYHETDLMPYRECAWSWATPGLMERFLLTERRWGVLQRRSVREVCVRGIPGYGNLSRRLRVFLGGLEVVWFWDGGGWICEVVERWKEEEALSVGRPN